MLKPRRVLSISGASLVAHLFTTQNCRGIAVFLLARLDPLVLAEEVVGVVEPEVVVYLLHNFRTHRILRHSNRILKLSAMILLQVGQLALWNYLKTIQVFKHVIVAVGVNVGDAVGYYEAF